MSQAASHDVFAVLQIAIGPVILISGVGLLLLSMTNRLGRAIDRARSLAREIRGAAGEKERAMTQAQIAILYRRARLLRAAILLSALAILLAGVLVVALFFSALFDVHAAWIIVVIFVAVIAALVSSLAAFLKDVHLSLYALELELELDQPAGGAVQGTVGHGRAP